MMALRILSLQNMSLSSEEQSMHDDISEFAPVPADDINRSLTVARVDSPALPSYRFGGRHLYDHRRWEGDK